MKNKNENYVVPLSFIFMIVIVNFVMAWGINIGLDIRVTYSILSAIFALIIFKSEPLCSLWSLMLYIITLSVPLYIIDSYNEKYNVYYVFLFTYQLSGMYKEIKCMLNNKKKY